MNKVLLVSDANSIDPAMVRAILQPVKEAAAANQPLAPEVLKAVVASLAGVVDRADQVPPQIYKPVIQAQQALLDWKGKTCQEYLTDLMIGVSLAVVAGGAVGQTPNILDQINVRYTDHGTDRRVTVFRPDQSFPAIYQALNTVPERKQNGVYTESRFMDGPKNDAVPVGEQTFTIHFKNPDPNGATRDEHVTFLGSKGETFSDPFLVAMAEGASLAQKGESLFKVKENYYIMRTAVAETANRVPVHALFSRDDGAAGSFADDDFRDHGIVAVGSANH